MPRYNFISKDGDGVGFAVRLQDEGNEVRVFIDSEPATSVGDGLVPKVGSIHDMLLDAKPEEDTFIFDLSGDGLTADHIRHLGFPVIGSCSIADRLERDREFGLKVMETCGDSERSSIRIPKSVNFTSFSEAKDYVAENPDEKLVYKPSNLLGDKSPSHVSYNAEDMLQLLENVERDVDMAEPEFVLQEFHKGIAVSSELWFDGSRMLPLCNHTLERKELMNGNIGPSGGCTGNVVWACRGCPLCDEVQKLLPFLKENHYHGPLDLNTIVAEDGIYGLEFTPRFGYDATSTLLWQLIRGDVGHFFDDIARSSFGTNSPQIQYDRFAAGLRLTIPPWPSEKFTAESGIPIFGLASEDIKNDVYLYNVKRGDITELETAGIWGILMLLTGAGKSISDSFEKPYEMAEALHVSNKQYRTDLVEQFEEDFAQLEKMGVIADAISSGI
jgi:phosphoribosylamine---glycine ligase